MALQFDNLTAVINDKKIPELFDSFFRNHPFERILFDRRKTILDGISVNFPLVHTGDANGTWIGEFTTFDLATTDPVTASRYTPKMYNHSFTFSVQEALKAKNNPNAVMDAIDNRLEVMKLQIEKNWSEQLWSRTAAVQTAAEFKWNNLENFMSTSSTVGEIATADAAQWKAKVLDAATDFGTNGDPTDIDDLFDPTKDVYFFTMLDKLRAQINDKNAVGVADIAVVPQQIFDKAQQAMEQQRTGSPMGDLLVKMGANVVMYRGLAIISSNDMVDAQATGVDGRIYMFTLGTPNETKIGAVSGSEVGEDDQKGAGLFYAFNPDGILNMQEFIRPTNQLSWSANNYTYGQLVTPDRSSMGMITGIASSKTYLG